MSCEVLEFYAETQHAAAKPHVCCECHKPISIGERYMSCRGKFDGDMFTAKQHLRCWHFARYVNHDLGWNDGDGCIEFGGIDEAVCDSGAKEVQDLWEKVCSGFEFTPPVGSKTAAWNKAEGRA